MVDDDPVVTERNGHGTPEDRLDLLERRFETTLVTLGYTRDVAEEASDCGRTLRSDVDELKVTTGALAEGQGALIAALARIEVKVTPSHWDWGRPTNWAAVTKTLGAGGTAVLAVAGIVATTWEGVARALEPAFRADGLAPWVTVPVLVVLVGVLAFLRARTERRK